MAASLKLAPLRLSAARSPMTRLASTALRQPLRQSRLPTTAFVTAASLRSERVQSQFRGFHASAKRSILPALPQKVDGGINDPAPVPEPHPTHGSYHWTFERGASLLLVPLTVAPFAAGTLNPTMDAILCATLLIHSHIGFQSIIIDYIPTWRLPKTRAAIWWGLRAATILAGVGLYEFETNDVGLTEAIKTIWKA